ncbi:MAG: NERD domain-containing protein [Lysobacter sp.]
MTNLILFVALLAPILTGLGVLLAWRYLRRDKRRSPLTFKVLNLPGESLLRGIEKHDEGYYEKAAILLMIGPVVLSTWLLARMDRVVDDWTALRFGKGDATFVLVGGVVILWAVAGLIKHLRERRKYLDGRAAELAVAQALMPLMADGALIYHDFPGDKFNIDHIVIGAGAVFAIETKSRRKPSEGGKESARVDYDGTRLKFPSHVETKPVEQARRQAQWLEKFLGSGVGESVRVIPVVALPGWYTQSRIQRPDVLVSNCHNSSFMVGDRFGAAMSPAMRKRIAHVLTERYPQLES